MRRQEEFRRRAAEALARPGIRNALGRFGSAYRTARAEALAVIDYEAYRLKLRASKEEAIEHLPWLVKEFTKAAKKAGAIVYEAKTAEEASAYIARLAKEKGVQLVIKGKSMVSEEIELNHSLEELGIQVLETDAGEWIIQRAGERPSHSVIPAIHLSKEEVAGIFTKALGRFISPDIPFMVSTLREELRGKFVEAGMGLSGANIAIAETGTLVLVTNEGNGRLVTTLPPIHVVLLGYEKIVPTFEEAAYHLKILARTATGQGLSVYTTFITGKVGTSAIPRPPTFKGGVEPELHIVLLDNGRFRMRDDPWFREALYCIRCASCANVCPTYRVVGGHVFGHIYTGVIGAVITPFHHGLEAAAVPQEACLLCRACYDACPAEINLPRMVVALRGRVEEREPTKGLRAFVFNHILPNPPLFRLALTLLTLAQIPFLQERTIRRLPGPLKRLTDARTLPALAPHRLRDRLGDMVTVQRERKARVAFFGSCLLDFVYPEIGLAAVKVLTHHGVEVHFPKAQSCCGLPAYYEGQHDVAKRMARQLVEVLSAEPSSFIVTATPPCGITIREYFPKLLKGDSLEAKAKMLAQRCFEFSEFLVKVLGLGEGQEPPTQPEEREERILLTYHDSCSALRGLKIHDAPRRLLKTLRNYEFRELDEIGECCGFGGHFSFDYPEVAGHVLDRKLAAIERMGAKVLALDSPGCLLQIRGGLEKRGSPIQVKHIAELLTEEL